MTRRHQRIGIVTAVLLGFAGSQSFAQNPTHGGPRDFRSLHPPQGPTILERIGDSNTFDAFYKDDVKGQLTDSFAGAFFELLTYKRLGTLPVSDIAEFISHVGQGNGDGAFKTFVKGVLSTAAGYGTTLLFPLLCSAPAPFLVPIVAAGVVSYYVKKGFDRLFPPNLAPPREEKTGITVGKVGSELGPMDHTDPTPPPPVTDFADNPDSTDGLSFEDVAAEAANKDGLRNNEPVVPTVDPAKGGMGVLDGHVDKANKETLAKTAVGFGLIGNNTKITKATKAGNKKLDEAKRTTEQGERDVMGVMEDLKTEIAKADRENSWNKAIGDALQTGVQAGGAAFGTAVGAGLADKASKSIFDTGKPGKSGGGSSSQTGVSSAGTSSSGHSGGGSSSSGGSGNHSGSSSSSSKKTPPPAGTNAPTAGTNTTTTSTTTTTGSTTATTVDNRFTCPVCGSKNTTFLHNNETTGYGEAVYKCGDCGSTVH